MHKKCLKSYIIKENFPRKEGFWAAGTQKPQSQCPQGEGCPEALGLRSAQVFRGVSDLGFGQTPPGPHPERGGVGVQWHPSCSLTAPAQETARPSCKPLSHPRTPGPLAKGGRTRNPDVTLLLSPTSHRPCPALQEREPAPTPGDAACPEHLLPRSVHSASANACVRPRQSS